MDQNRSLLVLGITATATVATMAITPAHADAASQFDSYKGQATVNLNVRSTPSTAKSPLATLKKGTTFEVVGKSGDWLKIKYKNNQDYVFSKFVKKVSTTSVTTLYMGTVTADYLNVRKSASASSTVLGSLKKGSSVSVVGTSGNWLKIKYKSGYAYVSGSYVKKASSAAASSSSSKQAADLNTLYTGTVTADYLNVRKSASASSAVLGALKKGSSVSVVGTSGNWLKIKYKSGYAYVSGSYVKKASSAAKPSSAKQAANLNTYTGTVTADYLNVRKAASASSTILGSLKEGSSVSVVGTSGNWLKVKYKSGYAYVSGSYVKKASASSGSSTSSSTSTSAGSTVLYTGTVTADYLNVRSSSSTSSTILGSLKKGSSVSVVGTSGNWLKIKYKSGYAYVSASYVKKAAASSGSSTSSSTSTSAGSTVLYTGTVTADYLNVRSSASASSTILGSLKEGTSVGVVGTSGNWLKIKYNNGYAYVSATYINKSGTTSSSSGGTSSSTGGSSTASSSGSSSSTQYTGVTTTAVHIRSQAKMGDNILATFGAGTTVTVVGGTADGWLKINYKNTYAYVYKDYVSGGTDTTTTTSGNSSSATSQYSISFGRALSEEQKVNSSSSLAYYLNPKNFAKGTMGYYQFLKLSSLANISESDATKILSGRGILSGHANDFLTAAMKTKVNEIYLMAHALLETGNGTSQLAKGVKYKGVTVYNFFGIGAYDGSAVTSGAEYAYNQDWTSPAAAILGGAEWIAHYYIYNTAYHQDTLYKMRWNPVALVAGAAAHQYATDPGWAYKQTSMIQTMYQMLSHYTIVYDVPAYK